MTVMKAQELAELVGKTYRRVKQIDDELLEDRKLFVKADGGFDAACFVQAWADYVASKVRGDGELNLEDEKARHEQLKREKTAIELERMRGEIIALDDAKRVYGGVAHTVAQRFLGLPTRLSRSLIMIEDAEVIEALLDQEIRETLTMLAETSEVPGSDGVMEDEYQEQDE